MTSLFIGTPCYRSDPTLAAKWAVDLANELGLAQTHDATFGRVTGCASIDIVRETLIADFLESGRDAILFRDDDIDCKAELVKRMLNRLATNPERIVMADYRKRIEPLVVKATEGLGLTLIAREVILAMHLEYGELEHVVEGRALVGIFDPVYFKRPDGSRIKKREDGAFFARARACGYSVGVVSPAAVIHAGLPSFF